ncbi:MAG: hypothetical protein R6W48_01435 [Gaiellaceae bacterium]
MPRPRDEQASRELRKAEPSTTQVAGDEAHPDRPAELVDAVQALSEQVGELRVELESFRAERARALPAAAPEAHGWDQRAALATDRSPAWVRSLDSPAVRRPAVPRFALEIAFLIAIAAIAAAARLDAPAIAGLLAVAWALVAAIEWIAWRSERRQESMLAGISFGEQRVESDLSWFTPPIERTAELDDVTEATGKLPPARPE